MELKELKTKIKIVFPEESEIFMAEEFMEALSGLPLGEKTVELDFSGIKSIDTVFIQLALGIIRSVKAGKNDFVIKSSEVLEDALALYGVSIDSLNGVEG